MLRGRKYAFERPGRGKEGIGQCVKGIPELCLQGCFRECCEQKGRTAVVNASLLEVVMLAVMCEQQIK